MQYLYLGIDFAKWPKDSCKIHEQAYVLTTKEKAPH